VTVLELAFDLIAFAFDSAFDVDVDVAFDLEPYVWLWVKGLDPPTPVWDR